MSANRATVPRWGGYAVVFAVGFAGVAAQALLFRKFLSVFEGNELGAALFFGSWLLWVAVGARIGRVRLFQTERLDRWFEIMPLAYIPAYAIQSWVIGGARELAGVQSYELFPLVKMVRVLAPANAPVSLCTGLLFTAACAWMGRKTDAPVAGVYIAESVGGALGGIAVTGLLAAGTAGETVFLAVAGVVAAGFCCARLSRGAWWSAWVPAALVAAAALTGAGEAWTRVGEVRRWARLLPRETLQGAFSTPQAKYLYGEYGGQFSVVAWESIAESLPGTEHASQVVAIHLAQHPAARRFLVVGPGSFALCRRLLDLPQAESVTWMDPDPAYPGRLLRALPERLRRGAERLTVPGVDVRRYLSACRESFDLAILNLPNASTLALNRYFTREFFLMVRGRLADSGVVGVRAAGGENVMGDELVNAGATVFHTLKSVFGHVVLKPGDETWLLASDGDRLSALPAVLRDRFAGVPGAAAFCPPDALLSLYVPDRIEFQVRSYEAAAARLPARLLRNTDRLPKALLHGLLFAVREAGAGAGAARAIRSFAERGVWVAPFALFVYGILRMTYRLRGGAAGRQDARTGGGAFDACFLVFSTGAAGMAASVILMFMYQSLFGSLFLDVGLVSALFMAGLSLGSLASRFVVDRSEAAPVRVAAAGLAAHALLLGAIGVVHGGATPRLFASLFVLAGICGGLYVPAAAAMLRRAGVGVSRSGAAIETWDHVGGAAGGVCAGVALLPLFGAPYALAAMAGLLLANAPGLLIRGGRGAEERADPFGLFVRRAGHALFGVVLFAVGTRLLTSGGERGAEGPADRVAAGAMAAPLPVEERIHSGTGVPPYPYYVVRDPAGGTNSYIVTSRHVAPGVIGYAGPVIVAMRIAADGELLDCRVVESVETPAYLNLLSGWLRGLAGRNLFDPDGLAGVDAVTGATLTSAAVLRTLRVGGQNFGVQVLGRHAASGCPVRERADPRLPAFAVLTAVAVAVRRRPSRWVRWGFLSAAVLACGVWMNAQFSLPHVLALLELKPPSRAWSMGFALAVGVPVAVVLFGNVYCGYLCPFGALQELAGRLRPVGWRTDPCRSVWRTGRMLKYLVLAGVALWFTGTIDPRLASADPLVTAFGRQRGGAATFWIAGLLLLSIFYGRFWCRALCPAGAFLALLNGVRLLPRLRPSVVARRCVFGVSDGRDLDCICCDRCRLTSTEEQAALDAAESRGAAGAWGRAFLALSVGLALLLFVQSVAERRWDRKGPVPAQARAAPGSEMRQVDEQRLRARIEQGTLSDRGAMHYVPVSDPAP